MTIDASDNRGDMTWRELCDWAWSETAPVHSNRANLLLHAVAVPLFVAAHVVFVVGAFTDWHLIIAAPILMLASLMLQKKGHGLEEIQVKPFSGPYDFFRRLYVEQFWNYWRFLLTGQWFTAFSRGRR